METVSQKISAKTVPNTENNIGNPQPQPIVIAGARVPAMVPVKAASAQPKRLFKIAKMTIGTETTAPIAQKNRATDPEKSIKENGGGGLTPVSDKVDKY